VVASSRDVKKSRENRSNCASFAIRFILTHYQKLKQSAAQFFSIRPASKVDAISARMCFPYDRFVPPQARAMQLKRFAVGSALGVLLLLPVGCQSPYHADQGALFGGVTGAGVGAVVGNAVGNPAAGALIGAGVGTVTGAAVGSSLDEIEARNRAEIARQMGSQIQPGVVTMADVVNMSHAGVSEQLIVTHIQHNGLAAPLTSADLITLKQQGVADSVIQVMQAPPVQRVAAVPAQPVIVEEHYYGGPYYGPYWHPRPYWGHHHHHGYHRSPRTSFGFSVSN